MSRALSVTSFPNPNLGEWRFPPGVQPPRAWYRMWRWYCRVLMPLMWKIRVFNRHFEPASGGAVYICNHQSFLDPMLMAFGLHRPMNFMARDTLFHTFGFRHLIQSVNAFPVRRGTADLTAIKEAMRRIKEGGQVVLFAEGTRTLDGRIGPLLPGVAMLAQRAAQWTVPVVIDGAYECWPRTQLLPSPGNIIVQYGQPMPQSEVRKLSAEDFVQKLRLKMIEIQTEMRRRIGRPELKY